MAFKTSGIVYSFSFIWLSKFGTEIVDHKYDGFFFEECDSSSRLVERIVFIGQGTSFRSLF